MAGERVPGPNSQDLDQVGEPVHVERSTQVVRRPEPEERRSLVIVELLADDQCRHRPPGRRDHPEKPSRLRGGSRLLRWIKTRAT